MKKRFFFSFLRNIFCIISAGIMAFILSCADSGRQNKEECLVLIGDSVITRLEFDEAMELAKAGYSHNELQDPDLLRSVQIRLLNQLIEEVMLSEKAREYQIEISDEELEKAVEKIKEDYPEEAFKEMFLKNSISLSAWKKRLKMRLLAERVIEHELEGKVVITEADVENYYKEQLKKEKKPSDLLNKTSSDMIESQIVEKLRRQKKEAVYSIWIKKIQGDYTVDINEELWSKITGS